MGLVTCVPVLGEALPEATGLQGMFLTSAGANFGVLARGMCTAHMAVSMPGSLPSILNLSLSEREASAEGTSGDRAAGAQDQHGHPVPDTKGEAKAAVPVQRTPGDHPWWQHCSQAPHAAAVAAAPGTCPAKEAP